MDVQKKMILNANLWRVMWQLSWPAIIAMVMYGLNLFLDAVFVGYFIGKTALAGVSVAYPLATLSMGLGSLIGVGAGSILSLTIGKNDEETQKRLLGNVNFLTILSAIIYSTIGLLAGKSLVSMMGASEEVLQFGYTYFTAIVFGGIFWIYGFASNMIIRAEGKMKLAALIMGLGLVVNVICNYIFVVWFNWGVTGVAWGSNIGMMVYSILGLLYFKSKKVSFKAKPFKFNKDAKTIKSISSLGMASFIIVAMSLVQAIVVFNAISKYGKVFELAFYGAVFRIMHLLMMPIIGVMRALQPTIGINFGAKKYNRVTKSFWIFIISSTGMVLPFWALIMLWPQSVLGTMLDISNITAAHLTNIRVYMSVIPILPAIFMIMTFFPSVGKGRPASVLGLLRQVFFYIPVMLILPALFGIKWIYWGSAFIDITLTIVAMGMVLVELKKIKLNIPENIIIR